MSSHVATGLSPGSVDGAAAARLGATDDGVTFALTPRTRRARRSRRAPTGRRSPRACPIARPRPGEQYRFHFDMGEVHRLQVLRRRLQRAERQSRRRSTGAASARSKAACIPNADAVATCRWAATTASSRPVSRAARSTPTRRTRSPASCSTAPTPASAASTARGTAPTACRSTTPSAAWSASATCATAGSSSGRRRRASARAPKARFRSRSSTSPSGAPRSRHAPRRPACRSATAACRRRASRCRRICRPTRSPRDITHVAPEHPHWPLVVMTVLTQLSVGAFATIWLLQLLGAAARLGVAALASLLVGGLALGGLDAAPRAVRSTPTAR